MRSRSSVRAALGATFVLSLVLSACAPARRGPGWVPVALDPPAGPGSSVPVVAAGAGDIAYLAWIEPVDSTAHRLVVSRLEDLRWSTPAVIAAGESLFVNAADTPALLALGRDTLVACWPWRMPGGDWPIELRVSRSTDGGRHWGAPVRVHRDRSPVEHGFASLAATPRGVSIAWLDARAGLDAAGQALPEGSYAMSLRATTMRADGRCDPETLLDARVCDCCPTAQIATLGGSLLAFRDRDPDEVRDIALLRSAAGSEWTGVPLERDHWRITGCPVNGPALTARGDEVAVAWFGLARDTAQVRLARSDDGGMVFGAPVRVDAGMPLGRAALALLPDGDAIAGWLEQRPGGVRLMARRVPFTGEPRPADTLAVFPAAHGIGIPRLVRVGVVVLAAWTDPAGPGRVHASLLTPR